MILVGQYDSPYVRRVAITLKHLGFPFEHDTRSVFGDFASMRQTNPLGRVPSLILDDGEVLIDSAAMLDWLDGLVGPERALIPRTGIPRRTALRRIGLATGAIDKVGAVNYERRLRPERYRWPDWVERCTVQATGAIAALDREIGSDYPSIDQVVITAIAMMGYVRMTVPELMPEGRYPALDALDRRTRDLAPFRETYTDVNVMPDPD